jgi:hypothetical protein
MEKDYKDLIKKHVKINKPLYYLNEDRVFDIFCSGKAINFDSKRPKFDFSKIPQYPIYMEDIAKEMSGYVKRTELEHSFNVCFGDHGNGMFFAYDLARSLNRSMDLGFRAVYSGFDMKTGLPKGLSEDNESKLYDCDSVLITYPSTQKPEALENMINAVPTKFLTKNKPIAGILVFVNILPESRKIKKIKQEYNFHSIVDIDFS